ncbi:MAG TPA: PilZ domain-containing protein [Brevundimonas sp.]|nr:PilZ domain-containing protein [Brevundimonas sp.]
MTPPQDRRFEPRAAADHRAVVIAPGLETPCLIADQSAAGMKLRLNRATALPAQVIVIDMARGVAIEADLAWQKGLEAGVRQRAQTPLRGLVPSRLAAAREVFRRLGG